VRLAGGEPGTATFACATAIGTVCVFAAPTAGGEIDPASVTVREYQSE
jgi:hypothetical protein